MSYSIRPDANSFSNRRSPQASLSRWRGLLDIRNNLEGNIGKFAQARLRSVRFPLIRFTLEEGRNGFSRASRKTAPQRIWPCRHVDVVGMEAGRRQYGVRGTLRWSRKFGGGDGLHNVEKPRSPNAL